MEINSLIKFYDRGVDVPNVLNKALLGLFNLEQVSHISGQVLSRLQSVSKMFRSGYTANYSELAKEYALYYLPVNMFKVWKPLLDLALKQQVRNNLNVLEFGSGPGSSTFGVIEFFRMLAEENKGEEFQLSFTLLEKEESFLLVFNSLFNAYKTTFPENLKVSIKQYEKDIFEDLSFLENETYDLLLESNVFNQNEGVLNNEIQIFEKLSQRLNPHSSIIMIEPGKTEMLTALHKIKNYFKVDNKLNVFAPCSCRNTGCEQYATAALKINQISILRELSNVGVNPKDKDYHYFEYVIFRNDKLTTHTNNCLNTVPLNELKNHKYGRVNIEANVLVTQITDKCLTLKICDGTLVAKNKVELYIPLEIINQTNLDKAKIDRGAKIRVKKVEVMDYNMLVCDECCSIEIER